MIIQPRGFKRESLTATSLIEIKRKVEQLAAMHNCSKSFVISTLLAKILNIKGQPDYVTYKSIPNGTRKVRSSAKTSRTK